MIVSFGYVSTALTLFDSSPSKTMTFATWSKLEKEEREQRLISITKTNLKNTLRIIHYNIASQFPLYRMSSSIVPLATHPDVNWEYLKHTAEEFRAVGDLVKAHSLRVSLHPNQFTLFTSAKKHITDNAVKDMEYHYAMLQAMSLEKEARINIHVGGTYGDKESSIARFYENIKKLPSHVKQAMTLENDDKTYTTEETLDICEAEGIPMMFDYHHHLANPSSVPLEELLPRFIATWQGTGRPPKVHLSSPKTEKAYRSHHDFVSLDYVMPFFKMIKPFTDELDVMIEAKQKDIALIRLMGELAKVRGIKRMSGGTLII
ncbi:UV DNA damage repair endonuclease UvsE [Fictibacillus sp. KIGAM418]|uniref:UV DNA damage endonuclease n=1 Tax=Fictibacillus marinisediminis TaxID=2878389 RepID=A0A9X2BHD2_9BACL|nr:UV DNA damage repair endonuclease UvsE [Fictibacillus marinisediminis]MCK6259257.1 UV DNA damage repair endonuclease UvsE [Fictibacillus marinisediminis]